MKTRAWLGALSAAAVAGCADYAPTPPSSVARTAAPASASTPYYGGVTPAVAPACFYTRDIRNHTVGDARTLYINVLDRMYYRIEMGDTCFAGATSSDPIVIRSPPGNLQVCRPMDLDVGVNIGGSTNRCIVSGIVPLSAAQVAALPQKLRP